MGEELLYRISIESDGAVVGQGGALATWLRGHVRSSGITRLAHDRPSVPPASRRETFP